MGFEKDKYIENLYFDEPINYKNLMINPVKVRDYFRFFSSIDVFLKEKNRIPDPKIISMSYMDYILTIIEKELENALKLKKEDLKPEYYINYLKFCEILNICMSIEHENIKFGRNNKGKFILILNDIEINKKDFEEIKGIICEQNFVELPDEKINPELKKALDEAIEFKNRNNAKMGSLEDQMICLMSEYHYDMDKIKKLSIRKFNKMLERADYKLHYKLYKQAEMQGAEFKSKLEHWMSEIVKDKYADVIVGYSETISKFEGKPSKN